MSSLRTGENVLYLPAEHPKVDLSPLFHVKPRPGEFLAVMDPPRSRTHGGILLDTRGDGWNDRHTEGLDRAEQDFINASLAYGEALKIFRAVPNPSHQEKRAIDALWEQAISAAERFDKYSEPEPPGAALELRPDSYTVAAVGSCIPFAPGDRVCLAPYAPRRLQEWCGVPDVVLVGLDDPWEDITILVWNPLLSRWEPVSNWIAVQIAVRGSGVATTRRHFHNYGKVLMAGPLAESREGETVALHKDRTVHRSDDTKWFATKFGPWDDLGVLLVREVDSAGERRVLGTLMGQGVS